MLHSRLMVKVWCLPRQTEEQIRVLHQALVEAVVKLDIGIKGEDDMIFLFPQDMMEYGLGSEIEVEVSHFSLRGAYELQKRALEATLKMILQQRFPSAHIQGSFLPGEDF